jgi:regulator of sirC expression with transglutaminase-like and TPR domain
MRSGNAVVPIRWSFVEATQRFEELLLSAEAEVPLDEAALVIAQHADRALDVSAELDRIDDLAAGCGEPTLDGMVNHLFVDLGFRGNRQDYYDPRNSYLQEVMRRRLGIPITLAVLAISVGRRIGAPVVGVGMPGHFLLRDQVDHDVFVDPFGGRRLDRRGCADRFRAVHGDEVEFDERFLHPVGTFAILARMLANLRAVALATADRQSLLWVLRLRSTIPGVPIEERGELASALAAMGSYHEAATEFDALADVLGGELGKRYRGTADRLRARLN